VCACPITCIPARQPFFFLEKSIKIRAARTPLASVGGDPTISWVLRRIFPPHDFMGGPARSKDIHNYFRETLDSNNISGIRYTRPTMESVLGSLESFRDPERARAASRKLTTEQRRKISRETALRRWAQPGAREHQSKKIKAFIRKRKREIARKQAQEAVA
jgi:hypothetical protein